MYCLETRNYVACQLSLKCATIEEEEEEKTRTICFQHHLIKQTLQTVNETEGEKKIP
jgi:hypothetical protein